MEQVLERSKKKKISKLWARHTSVSKGVPLKEKKKN